MPNFAVVFSGYVPYAPPPPGNHNTYLVLLLSVYQTDLSLHAEGGMEPNYTVSHQKSLGLFKYILLLGELYLLTYFPTLNRALIRSKTRRIFPANVLPL